jgi:hypothetical protein
MNDKENPLDSTSSPLHKMSRRKAKTPQASTKLFSSLPEITISYARSSSTQSRGVKRQGIDSVTANVVAENANRLDIPELDEYWLPNPDPDCVADPSTPLLSTNARRQGKVTCFHFCY